MSWSCGESVLLQSDPASGDNTTLTLTNGLVIPYDSNLGGYTVFLSSALNRCTSAALASALLCCTLHLPLLLPQLLPHLLLLFSAALASAAPLCCLLSDLFRLVCHFGN
jgi:hypothetical protein